MAPSDEPTDRIETLCTEEGSLPGQTSSDRDGAAGGEHPIGTPDSSVHRGRLITQPVTVLRYREQALGTAAGRADAERALVQLAARLDSSPALWSVDSASAALSLPGHLPEEVEAGLTADTMGPLALFDVAPV